jgi:hypothetical protein
MRGLRVRAVAALLVQGEGLLPSREEIIDRQIRVAHDLPQ